MPAAPSPVPRAATEIVRVPEPRRRVRVSWRIAGHLCQRVLVGFALVALLLLVAAPERHIPCGRCIVTFLSVHPERLRVVGPPGQLRVGPGGTVIFGRRPVSVTAHDLFAAFGSSTTGCNCTRHPPVEAWLGSARALLFPPGTAPPATPPAPARARR